MRAVSDRTGVADAVRTAWVPRERHAVAGERFDARVLPVRRVGRRLGSFAGWHVSHGAAAFARLDGRGARPESGSERTMARTGGALRAGRRIAGPYHGSVNGPAGSGRDRGAERTGSRGRPRAGGRRRYGSRAARHNEKGPAEAEP